MKTYNNLYEKIYSIPNLILAFKKARKGKTKKFYVLEFQEDFMNNINKLHEELKNETYFPKPLKTFILRDPKTRKISKAEFRDRIVHHAVCNIIEPIFDKTFIYDSCANRIGKGNLFGLRRFDLFKRKISENGRIIENKFSDIENSEFSVSKNLRNLKVSDGYQSSKELRSLKIKKRFSDNNYIFGYCLKADIKHYFQEVNHEILIKIISKKIKDDKLINLIVKILENGKVEEGVGMPLGNLTSQFFANVYLNELDYFIKHKLKAKYYLRYVDDFIILHKFKIQLDVWKIRINRFLEEKLKIELHPEKSRVIPLSRGIDFVGFKNFYYFRLLRKRNIMNMRIKITLFSKNGLGYWQLMESFQGWNAYAIWANTFKLRREIAKKIYANNNNF